MRVDERGRLAGQRTLTVFHASTDVAAEYDELLHRRRSQRRNRAAALAVSAVVAVLAVISVQANLAANPDPQPMKPLPGIDIGDVPVWYDDAGLHRGNIVEQTPVELRQLHEAGFIEDGALALVRTGALYLDPATGDVWFHPWGGDPRIVGHDSTTGPSANPDGDIAAWFEGGHLVVYDTAAEDVIVRELPSWKIDRAYSSFTCHTGCSEHEPPGNGFLEVSAERVVWTADDLYGPWGAYDLRTGEFSTIVTPRDYVGHEKIVVDVNDNAFVYADKSWNLVLDMPGQFPHEYLKVDPVDNPSRFSSSGNYVLSDRARVGASERRAVPAIIDTQTGELWPVPAAGYAWIAWSYGNIALFDTQDELLACDAAYRTCETLPAEPPFLMPAN